MERKFFTNDFEESLKEHVDEFKMVPSKRVWHGIYNDIHPGKRWPSVAMSLFLIFTLVVIGHLNTHNDGVHSTTKHLKNEQIVAENKKPENISTGKKLLRKSNLNYRTKNLNEIAASEIMLQGLTFEQNLDNINIKDIRVRGKSVDLTEVNMGEISSLVKYTSTGAKNSIVLHDKFVHAKNENSDFQKIINVNEEDLTSLNSSSEVIINNDSNKENLVSDENDDKKKSTNNNQELKSPASQTIAVKSHKKRNNNIGWTYFVTPAVGNVTFRGTEMKEPIVNNLNTAVVVSTNQNKVLHNYAFALSAGIQMNYKLATKLKFTTGIDISYSGYRIISNQVHPTFATLILKDNNTGEAYSRQYVTHYGDGTGESGATLRNYNWQISLPVGLQYEVYGNNKIHINTTANIEPSLVIKSNAYILSSEGRNYVTDPSLLRSINASSNFGAFISFYSGNVKWQIGPNIRYQLLSTYQKSYTIKEHLINYGFRIGISK